RRDMRVVGRARIDDRDVAAADDVGQRAGEGERPRIIGKNAPDAGRDLVDRVGLEIEGLVERDIAGHRRSLTDKALFVNALRARPMPLFDAGTGIASVVWPTERGIRWLSCTGWRAKT